MAQQPKAMEDLGQKPFFQNPILTQPEIDQLKKYVWDKHNTNLYLSTFLDPETGEEWLRLYWRGMTRKEYVGFMAKSQADMGQAEYEETLSGRIVMHPTLGKGLNMYDTDIVKAGVPSAIFKKFMDQMGFNLDAVTTVKL